MIYFAITLIDYGPRVVKVGGLGTAGISGLLGGQSMAGLAQKYSIGRSCGFGFIRFGSTQFGDSRYFSGIYQKRVTGYNQTGRIAGRPRRTYYVRMRTYRPTNPQTIPQQANRTKFADASSAWSLLTTVEKSVYNNRGKRRNRIGRNLFISEYMKTH